MKNRIMLDLAVYVVTPIALCKFIDINYLMYGIAGLIALVALYSIITKYKEVRLNISGIVFASLYTAFILLKQNVGSEFQGYVYDTYLLALCGLSIPLFNFFRKDIFHRIYVDILRAKGYNNLTIYGTIKKCELNPYFRKISLIVAIHLIVVSAIKVYSISTYGEANYLTTMDLEVLTSIIFLICEMYITSKIMSKTKEKIVNNKKKYKSKFNDSRVINFNQYKNINK